MRQVATERRVNSLAAPKGASQCGQKVGHTHPNVVVQSTESGYDKQSGLELVSAKPHERAPIRGHISASKSWFKFIQVRAQYGGTFAVSTSLDSCPSGKRGHGSTGISLQGAGTGESAPGRRGAGKRMSGCGHTCDSCKASPAMVTASMSL